MVAFMRISRIERSLCSRSNLELTNIYNANRTKVLDIKVTTTERRVRNAYANQSIHLVLCRNGLPLVSNWRSRDLGNQERTTKIRRKLASNRRSTELRYWLQQLLFALQPILLYGSRIWRNFRTRLQTHAPNSPNKHNGHQGVAVWGNEQRSICFANG